MISQVHSVSRLLAVTKEVPVAHILLRHYN